MRAPNRYRGWTLSACLMLAAAGVSAQTPEKKTPAKAAPAAPTTAAAAPAPATKMKVVKVEESGLAPTGQRYESESKKDPFLNPLGLKKPEAPLDGEIDRGTPPPGIAGMLVGQVAFLGTSMRDGSFTAVFRGTDKRFYFLRENDRFFDGFLKKIQGDSVVVVREKRMRSGKVETEEITRQLRTP
jgi:hypothetical protein